MLRAICIGAAVALGVLALVNGLYMLAALSNWYLAVPGVTTTGPFNQHYLRDIGLIFLLIGTMFLLGVREPHSRVFLVGTRVALAVWTRAFPLVGSRGRNLRPFGDRA